MSNPYKIDWNEYAALARQAVAEGCVLLKNDDKALPIRKGERVSVFGRIQFDYYKSGTGSGGAVNKRKQRHFRQRGAGADLPRLAEGPSV